MTQMSTVAASSTWRERTEVELLLQQLAAVDGFVRTVREARAAESASLTREDRLDATRARDVLQRQHDAMLAHVHTQLADAGAPWSSVVRRRAVLAHRNAWLTGRLAEALESAGVQVVARLENGADALGVALAEQPDLVLVEDALPMVQGPRVVAQLRDWCPATVVAAQVDHSDRLGVLLDAGATVAFVRRTPPADVAGALVDLLRPPS